MSKIGEYESDIQRYSKVKNQVISISTSLSNAYNSINAVDIELRNRYLVDNGCTPIANRTSELKNNIKSIIDMLNDKIISGIDNSAYSLSREIDKLKNEEKK